MEARFEAEAESEVGEATYAARCARKISFHLLRDAVGSRERQPRTLKAGLKRESRRTGDDAGGLGRRSDLEAGLAALVPGRVVGLVLLEEEGEDVAAVEGGGEVKRRLASAVLRVEGARLMLEDELDGRVCGRDASKSARTLQSQIR